MNNQPIEVDINKVFAVLQRDNAREVERAILIVRLEDTLEKNRVLEEALQASQKAQ